MSRKLFTVNSIASYIVSICGIFLLVLATVNSQCEPVETTDLYAKCKCKAGSFVFSLETLVTEIHKNPLYDKVPVTGNRAATDKSTYSYMPCHPASSTGCDGDKIAVCQTAEDSFVAGNQPTDLKSFYVGDPREGTLNFSYAGDEGRKSVVMIRCGKKSVFTALGETKEGSLEYEFKLETPAACYNPSLSTGSILCIIFFVGVFVYLLCGVLYMRFVRGARGVEMIPNLEIWRGLPGAAKDGVVFVMSGCKTDTTYSQI